MTENVFIINKSYRSAIFGRIVSVIAHYKDLSVRDFILIDTVRNAKKSGQTCLIYHCAVDMLVTYLIAADKDFIYVIVYLDCTTADADNTLMIISWHTVVDDHDIVALWRIIEGG